MNKESPRNFRYRYDLDGLRGIAIALVVIYHVFVGRVSGGVDVFLLLSGYFFLGSQLRYAANPDASLNPWWPLWRTARRLVPSLALVIGATYFLVRAFAPELMSTEFTQQITATMLYFQNWELAVQNADYVAASSTTSPLQHMWSMAVQGQFYLMGIIFALILAAIVKHRPTGSSIKSRTLPTVNEMAGPILIVVTIASFAYASRFGLYGPPENYYSTWSRAWELTLGAVLAIYGSKWVIPQRFADLFTGFGLLCLMFAGAIIADTSAYPGPLSLLPLGGAVLIILGGGGRISRAMASKSARWLGDVAYPLYLWHWPLLIVSTSALKLDTPPWWLGIIIIAISLVLADLTHRFVEKPLRQHRKRPLIDDLPVNKALSSLRQRAGAARGVGGVVVTACAVALLTIHPSWISSLNSADSELLNPRDYPGAAAYALDVPVPEGIQYRPDPILVGGITPPTSVAHCFIREEEAPDFFPSERVDGGPCLFGDQDAEKEVYVVGGSHAEQWISGLDKLGRQMGFKVVPMLRVGCPIELGDDLTVSPECAEWGKLVTERIIDAKPALVISNSTRPQDPAGHGPDYVPPGYAAFWEELANNDIPFLGLRDNPWGFTPEGMPRGFDECYVTTEDVVGCGMPSERVYAPVDPSAFVLSQYSNMLGLDTSTWFCRDGSCPVVIGNVMVYRDMHHISSAFADSAMPMLRDAIQLFLDGETVQQEAPEEQETPEETSEEQPQPVRPAPQLAPAEPVQPVPYPVYGAAAANPV